MFEGVDHVVIAVNDLERGIAQYEQIFGLPASERGEPPGETYVNAMFRFPETMVELISPKGPEGPVAKRLEARGEGVYLVAMRVDDLEGEIRRLRDGGVRLIGDPGPGKPATGMVFIHPGSAGGVLVQLIRR
ncbi:MAG: methylmalonyl-CoA epimerase [Chloroflexi bacterium]|nr:methylmalonyl-CoA epimerase [Chloroflexota bacterium]